MAASHQSERRGREVPARIVGRQDAAADFHKRAGRSPTGLVLRAAVISLTLVHTAAAQLTEADIAAMREQGRAEGWTFTVGQNGATSRSLEQLCGAVEPTDWRLRGRFDNAPATRDLPPAFDWRGLDGCTPVRDQGSCGSCWAFGAVGAMEAAIRIHEGSLTDLSEQWLVSCTWAGSCSGGWHDAALQYLHCGGWPDLCGAGGAVLETDFPYQAADVACGCPYSHPCCLDSWYYIGPVEGEPTVEQIKQAILQRGPVTVGFYVNLPFQAYTSGVFNACQHDSINHIVVLVGWDDSLGESGAWIVRNSWGTYWGTGGYAYVAYGCSRIGYAATYVNYLPPDCNENGVPDLQDIAGGGSRDCNGNDVPDECEPGGDADCDGNGVSDLCDIVPYGNDLDCNGNHIPDNCDLAAQTSQDCNANGRPDECEVPQYEVFKNSLYVVEWLEDWPDVLIGDDLRLTRPGLLQEVTFSVMNGYESQTILDSADLEVRFYDGGYGTYLGGFIRTEVPLLLVPGEHAILTFGDLESLNLYLPQEVIAGLRIFNNVGGEMVGQVIADPPTIGFSQDRFYYDDGSGGGWYWFGGDPVANFYWEIVVGTPDCNENGIPDECDIATGTAHDDNSDGIPDGCQSDCNGNGVLDDLDLAAGTSSDCNANDTPDECELAMPQAWFAQAIDNSHWGAYAQSFADIGWQAASVKSWDDFTTEEAVHLGAGRAFFTPYDWEGFRYYDFLVEVADAPGGAEAGAQVVLSTYGWGEFGTGVVSWDFDDALLPAGTWWISVQASGGYYLDGLVYWYRSNVSNPNGSEHYLHNPGGVFGISDPTPASAYYGTSADLAFELDVVVHQDCNANSILDACESGLDPVITRQPASRTAVRGQPTTLSVAARATTPLSYQWQKDGEDLPFGTEATYAIPRARFADGGVYRVRVSCPCGTVYSREVTLTIGFSLDVSVEGDGQVALDPPGGVYVPDTVIQLSATAEANSGFSKWEGDAAGGDTPTYVVMVDNRDVTAVFKRHQCTLTLWVEGQGVVEGSPRTCAYDIGAMVPLIAKPDEGWHFARWTGDGIAGDGSDPAIDVTLGEDRTLTAVFERGPAPSQQTDTDQPPADQTAPAGLCGVSSAAASLTALLLMGSLRSRRRTRK